MITYRVVEVKIHIFFSLELDGGDWSDSRSGRFVFDTQLIGGWVDHVTFGLVYRLNAALFSTFSMFL
jgi:hypothetical protein